MGEKEKHQQLILIRNIDSSNTNKCISKIFSVIFQRFCKHDTVIYGDTISASTLKRKQSHM